MIFPDFPNLPSVIFLFFFLIDHRSLFFFLKVTNFTAAYRAFCRCISHRLFLICACFRGLILTRILELAELSPVKTLVIPPPRRRRRLTLHSKDSRQFARWFTSLNPSSFTVVLGSNEALSRRLTAPRTDPGLVRKLSETLRTRTNDKARELCRNYAKRNTEATTKADICLGR